MKLITKCLDYDYYEVIDLDSGEVSEDYIRPFQSDLSDYVGGQHSKLRVISLVEWQILELLTHVLTSNNKQPYSDVDMWSISSINFYDDFIRKTGDTSIGSIAGYVLKLSRDGFTNLYKLEGNKLVVRTHNKEFVFHVSDVKKFTKLLVMGNV